MKTPYVSICIPAYQAGQHLEETLRSALAQTYPDLEVLVLDNASTDETPDILARYADDPRLRVVRNDEVLPLADNWNRAVALSRGELVKLVCADDLVHPEVVAEQVARFAADPSLAVVSCRRHIIRDDSSVVVADRGLPGLVGGHTGRATVRTVVRRGGNPIGEPGCVMFRRADFDAEGGFDAGLMFPMDLDLWMRLLRHGGFHGLPRSLAAFRAGTTSISASLSTAQYADQRVLSARLGADPFWQVDPLSRGLGRLGNLNAALRHRVLFLVSARARRRAEALEWSVGADSADSAALGARDSATDLRAFLRDGTALGASAMFTALIGLVGWLVAAHLLGPAEVGHATAFVNGFLLVAAVAELGLGQAALRWLGQAGSAAPLIVRRVYAGALASCAVVAVAWTLVAPVHLRSPLLGGTGERVLFVAAALVWMLFHVQDFVLTGLGAARWVPVENVSFGLVRIALLIPLAQHLGALGLVLSWVLGTALCVLAVTTGLVRSAPRAVGPSVLPARRAAMALAGGTWFSTLGVTLLNNLVPVLVVARYGAATGAVFAVVWLGLSALDLAGAGFGNALVVRLRSGSMALFAAAMVRVLPLFAVPLAAAALLSDPLLRLFGAHYAVEGETLLRLVVVGALFRAVTVLIAAIHLAHDRAPRMAALHWATAAALIALATMAPVERGLGYIGAGYVVVQVVLAVVAVVDLMRCARREGDPARGSVTESPADEPRRTPLAASPR